MNRLNANAHRHTSADGQLQYLTAEVRRLEELRLRLESALRDTEQGLLRIQRRAAVLESRVTRAEQELRHAPLINATLSQLKRDLSREYEAREQLEAQLSKLADGRTVRKTFQLLANKVAAAVAIKRRPEVLREIAELRASGAFAASWYEKQYPDIRNSGLDALTHYVLFGDKEGRQPNEIFDPAFYRRQVAGDDAGNALLHYLNTGAKRGLDPHPNFDASAYLAGNADVRDAGENPLLHYLRHGRAEHRQIFPCNTANPKRASVPPPQPNYDWQRVVQIRERASQTPAVDVVIPVYRGVAETLGCLYSVLAARVETPYELIVVNDASPEPKMRTELEKLVKLGLITLVTNKANSGFVKSVNRGMALNDGRDVLLLNSDTVVYNDWLDRIRAAAHAGPRTGTVTPLSNNATICSYPVFVADTNEELELDYGDLDLLARDANGGRRVAIPTAVGFCMYIRRDCLKETGLFDADRFGLGYGEENDFCLRAALNGWEHVLAADVFVRHHGGVSFQGTAKPRMAKALARLEERFPTYSADIQEFVKRDPGRYIRERLDLARLKRHTHNHAFLMFANPLGGGSDRHVSELIDRLEGESIGAVLARVEKKGGTTVRLEHPAVSNVPNLPAFDLADARGVAALAEMARMLGIGHLHIQHPAYYGLPALRGIQELALYLGIHYDVTTHDYMAVCPRVFMVDASGMYCGGPPLHQCQTCVDLNGSMFGQVNVAEWRAAFEALLGKARRVFVPSEDVAHRLAMYYPNAAIVVRPHAETIPTERARKVKTSTTGGIRHVAIIGAIGQHKGFDVLLACAMEALRRGRALHFHVIGFTQDDTLLAALPNVTVSGRYKDEEVQSVIERSGCDIAWFPSVCPETYSYALSHALRAGLHPVVFDIGAPAERLRRHGWGTVVPLETSNSPATMNDILESIRPEPAATREDDWGASYGSMLGGYYQLETLEERLRMPHEVQQHMRRMA